MNIPLVTIGIINYNCKMYLENCLMSYFNQSYKNLEIILIDDASTDGSVEILKAAEHAYKNIRCIYHEKNSGGPSQAIQEIIKEAQGEYFQWIASDDYVEKHTIQKFVDYLEETSDDYVYCNFSIVNENNSIIGHWNYSVPTLNEMACRIFKNCSGVLPMNGLYRTRFFHENNLTWCIYKDNDHSSDTINSLHFIKNGMKYGMIQECLINYRVHHDNCSHNIVERVKTSLSVYDYIINNFDASVYMPEIEWTKHTDRAQLKNYALASFFYDTLLRYMNLQGIPQHLKYSISKETLLECMEPYRKEGMKYLHEGLSQGDSFKNELKTLEDKYINIFKI